jgi:subtilase family serine protease
LKRFMRHLVAAAAVAVAAATAGTAGATPFHPAAQTFPFRPLAGTPAEAAQGCFNGAPCYLPDQIGQAYDFPTGQGAPTGAGQTILIVDAYGSPTLASDLATFDGVLGIPAPNLTIVQQKKVITGGQPSGDLLSWGLETTLDVEWAHALAPGAKIVLAIAADDDSANLVQVEKEALDKNHGAILTQSFGGDESGPAADPDAMDALDRLYADTVQHGGTVIASSGDYGATNGTPFEFDQPFVVANYPASSPFVLAVGGTEGLPYPDGLWTGSGYGGEQVWNEYLPATGQFGASGGAPSTVYPQLPWQAGITPAVGRAEPDVAFDAAANGGVLIVFRGGAGAIGGTSVGSPAWAAIVALANEARGRQGRGPLGIATPLIYSLAQNSGSYARDFHDITVGTNALFQGMAGLPGFDAGAGYDYPTGLGTPDVTNLIGDLATHDVNLKVNGLLRSHGHGNGHGHFGPGR